MCIACIKEFDKYKEEEFYVVHVSDNELNMSLIQFIITVRSIRLVKKISDISFLQFLYHTFEAFMNWDAGSEH